MTHGDAVELQVTKLVAGGDGLAFLDGKAVFVPLALPGEKVLASITRGKKDYAQARLLEVLEPSPQRVVPPCPIYGECGGCNLQHLDYRQQLAAKAGIVAESFSRIGRIDSGVVETLASLPFAYRNRVQFHFTRERRLGFMKRSSADLVEAPSCMVALRPIQNWMEERAGTRRAFDELEPYVLGKDRFLAFGYGDEVWIEGEKGLVEVMVAGQGLRFHIRDFFQSNLYLLDYFVPEALSGLSGLRAADLYCGVGLFASFLSASFQSLVCVEQNPHALELAKLNAAGGSNEFSALPVEDWVKGESAKLPFDLVLVDPPRTGLAAPVREWLVRARPRVIVYVSCDPVTLARDSGDLVRAGYELQKLKAYDFYPQTSHVECCARFTLA